MLNSSKSVTNVNGEKMWAVLITSKPALGHVRNITDSVIKILRLSVPY